MRTLIIVSFLSVIFISSCSDTNSSMNQHNHHFRGMQGDGIYKICYYSSCQTPYGDSESSGHLKVKIIDGMIIQCEQGYLDEEIPCEANGGNFTDGNCEISFDVSEFVTKINKNDTLPF